MHSINTCTIRQSELSSYIHTPEHGCKQPYPPPKSQTFTTKPKHRCRLEFPLCKEKNRHINISFPDMDSIVQLGYAYIQHTCACMGWTYFVLWFMRMYLSPASRAPSNPPNTKPTSVAVITVAFHSLTSSGQGSPYLNHL